MATNSEKDKLNSQSQTGIILERAETPTKAYLCDSA